MDDARKAEIRARLDGLSKPLRWCPSLTGAMVRHVARNCDIDCPQHDHNGKSDECPGAFGRYDGEFIAAAPNDVADLLAEVERLTAQIARVEGACDLLELSAEHDLVDGESANGIREATDRIRAALAAEKGGDDA